jgi:hypothetical protein
MKTKHTLILGSLLFASVSLFAQDKPSKENHNPQPSTREAKPVQDAKPATKPAQEVKKSESQDAKAAAQGQGQPTAEEQAWMAYMTPGPMHKMLASANGMWDEDITMWMAPDAEPIKSTARCSNTMIMGERYQESFHKGNMMGMPFEGRSIVGYDNAKKMFQSTWVDNMGSGVMFMEGKYDENTKTIALAGKMVDPSTGKEQKIRETYKFVDDNNQLLEMYCTKDGKEFKTMEIKFKRSAQ